MERRARFRTLVFVTMILLIISLFALRQYKLQAAPAPELQTNSLTYDTVVKASRGMILDRNGNVLVGNRASYNLVIINYVLFNSPHPNQSLLGLLSLCDDLGVEIHSNFPVTVERPYSYTLDDYSEAWQDYFRKFVKSRGWDTDIQAGTLMNNLREDYNIPEDLSDQEAHRLISVRYELELRGLDGEYTLPLSNYTLAKDVSAEQLASIKELGVPGVIVETATVREYNTPYAAHILGTVGPMDAEDWAVYKNKENYTMGSEIGKDGVERAFEEYLHGVDGLKRTTVSADGEILDEKYLKVPQPGGNVEISVDLGLQTIGENALEKTILDLRENGVGKNKEGQDADGGAVVAMDVKTGEVLVSASYPTFDPATFNRDYNQLVEDPHNPIYNRALLAAYPPGSIYKMATAITAMDYAGVGPGYEVVDNGYYDKYTDFGYTPACYIVNSSGITHGSENVIDAIRDSCNYYFYDVGLKLATKDLDYVAQKLGLGEHTGIELYENLGTRANPENKRLAFRGDDAQSAWVDGDKLMSAIGQDVNYFTPMQMANYTASLANEGVRHKATFLRRVVSWDFQELLRENQPEIVDTLEISETAMEAVEEGMIQAASHFDPYGAHTGTAQKFLHDFPLPVAAKTGTAQHGEGGSDHASFVCYAPVDDPQIAIAVYVEHGSQGGNLGQVARAILDAYFSQASKYETTNSENTVH